MDALKAEELEKNTIIVFWGDHSLWAKHSNFEQAIKAPLLISVPNMTIGFKILSLHVTNF